MARTTARKTAAKRELIDAGSDKRFVRRRAVGSFKKADDAGFGLTRDRLKKATTMVRKRPGGEVAPAEGADLGGLLSRGRWTER